MSAQIIAQQLYVAYFGRPADSSGFQNLANGIAQALPNARTIVDFLAAYNAGNAQALSLANAFTTSLESAALYGNARANPEGFVNAIYLNVLDRPAEFSGLNFWAGKIASGELNPANVALEIIAAAVRNGSQDSVTVSKKTLVAQQFTDAINTSEEALAYRGDAAAAAARALLNDVDSTTDVAAFAPRVTSTLDALVNPQAQGQFELNNGVVTAPAGVGQIRTTFVSADVGNGNPNNAAGELAVAFQREDAAGNLISTVIRGSDEGATYTARNGQTFDVRDVSGIQRGDQFTTVILGSAAGEVSTAAATATYINAGQGNDVLVGGAGADFLVGGAGNDRMVAGNGDKVLGGGDLDTVVVTGARADYSASTVGADTVLVNNVTGAVITLVGNTTENVEFSNGQTFNVAQLLGETTAANLTAGTDTLNGNVFNAGLVFTPGGNDRVNSLQDEDTLNGQGVNPTLNATLGAPNDAQNTTITPTLNGVQTINVDVTGGVNTLSLQQAVGVNTLNVNRVTQQNAAPTFAQLAASTTNLSLSNSTEAGVVKFQYREEVLTGTNETLNVTVNAARVSGIELAEGTDMGADAGFFFETVNLTSNSLNDIDALTVQANGREDILNGLAAGATRQTLNITANGTPTTGALEVNNLTALGVETINIVASARVDIAKDPLVVLDDSNDGIATNDLEVLNISGAANVLIDGLDSLKISNNGTAVVTDDKTLTVNAGTMTGNLRLGVKSASDAQVSTVFANRADKDLSVTSGSGNDEIRTYGGLAGDITTNAGADTVAIRNATNDANADVEGVSTINTGEGNDTVSAQDLLVTASDINVASNGGFNDNDVTAAAIITGAGNDSVTVRTLTSQVDGDNGSLEDNNADDTFFVRGASIDTGADNDTVTLQDMAEGSSVSMGAGVDTFNVELAVTTVLAADTVDVKERNLTNSAADLLGAVVDLGEGADTANFIDSTSLATLDTVIVGNDAELRGGADADVLNVTALDAVTVASRTGAVDAADTNATITGFETANFTVANQIDAATAAATTGFVENDNVEADGLIRADVARFDSALTAINLISQEEALLQNPALEIFEAGTRTNFELSNLRSGIATSLSAFEATGVVGGVGARANDTQLAINATTGAVTTTPTAADVRLNVDMVAAGAADTFTLNVNTPSATQAVDLSLGMFRTNTADGAKTATGSTANMVENVVINFADANAHSVDMNGFGDAQFRTDAPAAVAADVSSPVATSFTLNTGAAAGTGVQVDNVTADSIRFNNAAGTAVTAADVTVRVSASNNYTITTGSGTDIIDMRADDVRSDDLDTMVNRADVITANAGRDTMIVSGTDNLGVNNNLPGAASTIIDDDVFERISGLETVLSDTNTAAGTQMITLDEAAQVTGVDTLRLVGDRADNAAHALTVVVGNNFNIAAGTLNGELLENVTTGLVIDASLHRDQTTLNLESKDDDADQDRVDMDIRVAAKAGTTLNLFNSGAEDSQVEVRVFTADEADTHIVSSANGGNIDGLVDINVTNGSFDKLVFVEDSELSNNGGAEGAMTVAIDAAWTRTNGSFAVDASAVMDTDTNVATGGATITAAAGDTATLNIKGTQNSDAITGGNLNDTIEGNAGNDVINAGAGADTVMGGAGVDTINGQSGNDTIDGGEGNDVITGGLGMDMLTGGAGNDTFVINAVQESIQSTADRIADFATGSDRVSIENMVASNGSTVNLGRFASVANSGDGDNSLDGTVAMPKKFDAYYSQAGQLAIDVDGDGDITDINDIVINSANAINAGDVNYQISIAGGDNTVRLGQGVDRITTGAGNDTFVIVGSLDSAQVSAYDNAGAAVVNPVGSVVNYNDLLTVRNATEANQGDTIFAGAGVDTLHLFGNVNLSLVDIDLDNNNVSEIENMVVHSTLTMTSAQFDELVMNNGKIVLDGNTPHSIVITDRPATDLNGDGDTVDLGEAVTTTTVAEVLAILQYVNQGTASTLSITGTTGESMTFTHNGTDFVVATDNSASVAGTPGVTLLNGLAGATQLDNSPTVAAATARFAVGAAVGSIVDTAGNVSAASPAVLQAATTVTATEVSGNISANAVLGGADVDNLQFANNANVTMTIAQHAKVNSAAGNNAVTLTDAGTVTANTMVEMYTLANGTNQITLTALGQDVTGGTGNDTVITNGISLVGSTLNGGVGAVDVLSITGGNADLATVSEFEQITLGDNLSATMSIAQNATITAAAGVNTVTLNNSGVATGNAMVESYMLFTGGDTFTLGVATQNVNANDGSDILVFGVGNYTGTINGGNGIDQANVVQGTNFNAATANVSNIETLQFTGANGDVNVGASAANFAANFVNIFGQNTTVDRLYLNGTGTFDFTTKVLNADMDRVYVFDNGTTTLRMNNVNVTVLENIGEDNNTAQPARIVNLQLTESTSIAGKAVTVDDLVADGANVAITLNNANLAANGVAKITLGADDSVVLALSENVTFGNGQINGLGLLNANELGAGSTLAIGTGADGLRITADDITNADATLTIVSASNVSIAANIGIDDNLTLNGTGTKTITAFSGDNLVNLGTGALDVTIALAGGNLTVNTTNAVSNTINAAAMADNEVLTLTGSGTATVNGIAASDVTAAGFTGAVTFNGVGSLAAAAQSVTGNASANMFNLVAGQQATDTVTLVTGLGIDNININAMADKVVANYAGNAAFSTLNSIDIITGFRAGDDKIKFLVADEFSFQSIASADAATLGAAFQSAATAAIAANAQNWNSAGDVLLVQVQAGAAAGTYALVNDAANGVVSNVDLVVQLVGTVGNLAAADFIA